MSFGKTAKRAVDGLGKALGWPFFLILFLWPAKKKKNHHINLNTVTFLHLQNFRGFLTIAFNQTEEEPKMKTIRVGIITVSDSRSRGEREDKSGEMIKNLVLKMNAEVVEQTIIPDELKDIQEELVRMVHSVKADLIITTGGTGLSSRDVTPEATLSVIDKEVPGFAEAMRAESFKKTSHALLSRAVVGIRRQTLIINLPGSPKAVEECLTLILPAIPHAIEVLRGEAIECGKPPTDQ
jgi:molybdopterin adenylyltransferase